MKKLILFLLLLPAAAFAQKPQFTVKYSVPYAVYTFVERISANYGDNPLRELYRNSTYNNDRYNMLLADYEQLDLSQSFFYEGYPHGQKIPYMVITMVRHNLVAASTPEEFRQRSLGLIPSADLAVFVKVLEAFTPVYNELVYEPNRTAFEEQLKELTRYVAEEDIAGYFNMGIRFYNSQWDASTPFIINIFPKIDSKGFRATALVNNAISEVPVTFKDYDVLFAVMLHEIYHILYNEQPLKVQQEIAQWFGENPSPSAQYAYLLLNEVLATAMGNGFVYEQLTGATDTEDWYNFTYINKLAQEIYPVVKQYALQKKAIDKAFVDAYIAAYDKFPNWRYEAQHLFTYRAVAADDENDLDYFSEHYPYASIYDYEVPLNRIALERLKEKPVTRIIIISKDNEQKLEMALDEFPELKKYKLKASREFLQAHLMPDRSYLIIVNRKTSSFTQMMDNYLKDGSIPK